MDPGSRSGRVPHRSLTETRTLGRTPSVWPWNRCVKSCFLINCQLLPPFTRGPWFQQWAVSTSVPSPMRNQYTGADTKCQTMEPMCQIMFFNQLPTSDTIHKWTLAPEVGQFHIGALSDEEPGHWAGHLGHETNGSNHDL